MQCRLSIVDFYCYCFKWANCTAAALPAKCTYSDPWTKMHRTWPYRVRWTLEQVQYDSVYHRVERRGGNIWQDQKYWNEKQTGIKTKWERKWKEEKQTDTRQRPTRVLWFTAKNKENGGGSVCMDSEAQYHQHQFGSIRVNKVQTFPDISFSRNVLSWDILAIPKTDMSLQDAPGLPYCLLYVGCAWNLQWTVIRKHPNQTPKPP